MIDKAKNYLKDGEIQKARPLLEGRIATLKSSGVS